MSASRGDQAELIQIPVVCDFSDDGAEDDSPVEADRTPPPQRCPADAICDSTVDAPGDVALSVNLSTVHWPSSRSGSITISRFAKAAPPAEVSSWVDCCHPKCRLL